ncbi:class I SAM-dependent methyltransferase [Nocardia sp. NPDC050406]|uniref:class I SAM-dependent methyltransferase n=1 Tax=Nocardia sp. NPDC050406 TaxID=3364318 RepID=UPI00379D1546
MNGTQQGEQAKRWNSHAGRAWAEMQGLLDGMFAEVEKVLVATVSGRRVLDVGCGTGGTTLAVARAIGGEAECVGVDISEAVVEFARGRAEREGVRAEFVRADAQEYGFEAGRFDMVVSRFGVMFFEDPVRAFANLRGAVRDGGELACVVWRAAEENPFMTTAERAAAPLLELPERVPDAPGQFGFADRERVRGILEESGWSDIDISPVDIPCAIPEPDLLRYLRRMGPVGLALQGLDEQTRDRVIETVRPAFDPFVRDGEVRYTAACWLVRAASKAAK